MAASTYDFGFSPGTGANREDLGGGKRKRPGKRRDDREAPADTIPPAPKKPIKRFKPQKPNYA